MQRIILTISCLSTRFVVNSEETCGEYLLPNEPVHFSPSHGSQWRLLALAGQKQDGTIISGVESEPTYPTVIRGHWAIGELEFWADGNCEESKHASLKKDTPVFSPLHTTYGWQDDSPVELPFNMGDAGGESPWYSEMRAVDGCSSSEFWSQCYQCKIPEAWYGISFLNDEADVTQIKCVRIFQKDADAYTATHVELQRWEPADGAWNKKGEWTGLNGGRWFILKDNTTVAVAGAPGNAMPNLVLGLFGVFLWAIL